MGTNIWDLTNNTIVSASQNEFIGWYASNFMSHNSCDHGSCSSSSSSYICSGGHYLIQKPSWDQEEECYHPGTYSGSTRLWSNSTSWDGSSGSNLTLIPAHKYALAVFFDVSASLFNQGVSSGFNGSSNFSTTFNPPGASGSISVNLASSTGGLSFTSLDIAKVV
ncbi:MAG TPA: hypothetical protein VGV89_06920 [Thermoplasmata archaeon]|nr:hypothetical protein [Thermoplasmata archaeon]